MVSPAIDRAAEGNALRACAAAAMTAADGRGVRGARTVCRNALVKAGHRPDAAMQLAEAIARFGVQTQRHAVTVAAAIVATLTGCASPAPAPAGPGMRCTLEGVAVVLGDRLPMTSGPGFWVYGAGPVWFVEADRLQGCRR